MKIKSIIVLVLLNLLIITACTRCPFRVPEKTFVELPGIFDHHMVLQRDQAVPIWGFASPGKTVQVIFRDQKKKVRTGADSTWKVMLSPMDAGGPDMLMVKCGTEGIALKNVMVGEVWLCSGQSNMEMSVISSWATVVNAEEEARNAKYPDIRLFRVEKIPSIVPASDVTSEGWKPCNPESVENFSAVGYFFGRKLYQDLNIPIGLIQSAWGGTVAEAWTSAGSLRPLKDFTARVDTMAVKAKNSNNIWEQYIKDMNQWNQECAALDPGIVEGDTIAMLPDFDDTSWPEMQLPTFWEDTELGDLDGAVWFRKTITLSEDWAGTDLTLKIGPCDDIDITYFNGHWIGQTDGWRKPRVYTVPASLVKAGRNVIVSRVLDTYGGGGIWGEPEQFKLINADKDSLQLDGTWKYTVAFDMQNSPLEPSDPNDPNSVTVLYNGMIDPLVPFSIQGAIWYQGESNANRAYQYREVFPNMIRDWRKQWNRKFPFYFVQLASYMERNVAPVESDWAELREAQTMALSLNKTGMAVAIDIGDAVDIHPGNKQDVGKRLALWALNKTYRKDIPYSGPLYSTIEKEESAIRIVFEHTCDGLKTSDERSVTGFAIAGLDSQFVWANAIIDKGTILVSSPDVENPIAVRYGWSANPDVNLVNSEGLPASPFRTDNWPGVTVGKK